MEKNESNGRADQQHPAGFQHGELAQPVGDFSCRIGRQHAADGKKGKDDAEPRAPEPEPVKIQGQERGQGYLHNRVAGRRREGDLQNAQ